MSDNKQAIFDAVLSDDLERTKSLLAPIKDIKKFNFNNELNIYFNHYLDDYETNDENVSILHIAAAFNSLNCFKYIVSEKILPLTIATANKYIPLHFSCFFGSVDVSLYILSQDPEESKYHTGIEKNPIFFCAVRGGEIDIIKELLKSGASILDPWNDQYRILSVTIQKKYDDILAFLLPQCDPNCCYIPNGPSLAIESIRRRKYNSFNILFKPKDLTYYYYDSGDYTSIFTELLKQNAKEILLKILNDHNNISIEPPIRSEILDEGVCHWACKCGDLEVAKALLKTQNYDINRFNREHKTGVFYLRRNNDFSMKTLELLIKYGFDINGRYSVHDFTFLEFLIMDIKIDYELVESVVGYGADVDELMRIKDMKNSIRISIRDYAKKKKNEKLNEIFSKFDNK